MTLTLAKYFVYEMVLALVRFDDLVLIELDRSLLSPAYFVWSGGSALYSSCFAAVSLMEGVLVIDGAGKVCVDCAERRGWRKRVL
jgi:hypothetical protein